MDQTRLPDMTRREIVAAIIAGGLLADHKDHQAERQYLNDEKTQRETCEQAVARLAVKQTDALLQYLQYGQHMIRPENTCEPPAPRRVRTVAVHAT